MTLAKINHPVGLPEFLFRKKDENPLGQNSAVATHASTDFVEKANLQAEQVRRRENENPLKDPQKMGELIEYHRLPS